MAEIVKANSIQLDEVYDTDNGYNDPSLSRSAIIAHNINSDQQAKFNEDVESKGIDRAFATQAESPADLSGIGSEIAKYNFYNGTKTGEWLKDPDNAKIGHEDIEELSTIENIYNEYINKPISRGANSMFKFMDILAFPIAQGIDIFREGDPAKDFLVNRVNQFEKENQMIVAKPTNFAGEVAQGFIEFVPKIATGPLAASMVAGSATTETTMGLMEQGVDEKTAGDLGMISGLLSYLAIKLPVGKEKQSYLTTIGKLFAANEAITLSEKTIQKLDLWMKDYNKIAENIDILDPKEMGKSLAIAAILGSHSQYKMNQTQALIESANKSKIRQRDLEAYKDHVREITKDESVEIPIDKIDEIALRAGKTPEELLPNPEVYAEAKLTGKKVEVPLADIVEIGKDITPEDFNDMAPKGFKSKNEEQRAIENKQKNIEKGVKTGEEKPAKLATRVEGLLLEKKLIDEGYGDIITYDTESHKGNISQVIELLDTDWEKAKRIALSEEDAGQYHRTMVYNAVKERAGNTGDIELGYKLMNSPAASEASRAGQEIKAADSFKAETDPIRDGQQVLKERKERIQRTGKKTTDNEVSKIEKDIERVDKEIVKSDEKASKDYAQKKIEDTIKRQQRKEARVLKREELDLEFKALNKELSKILSPNQLNVGLDPKAIAVIVKMAENRIRAGFVTVDGLVDSIHSEIKDFVEISKRELRDAISGYGKTTKPNQEEVAKKLRELKSQARLISALEDAESGKPPLKSGFQRDAATDEVRELTKKVKVAMDEAGIETRTAEQQLKTTLDSIKTRLSNEIKDLEKQLKTGEKPPQKGKVEYDIEASQLQYVRDILKGAIEKIEGKKGLTDEQRIKIATDAVEKSIAEYERRIKEKELKSPKKESKTPETPELKALKDKRDSLKKELAQMIKDAKPPKDPEAIRRKIYKTRLEKEIKSMEETLQTGEMKDTTKPERVYDAGTQKLIKERDNLKELLSNAKAHHDKVSKEEFKKLMELAKNVKEADKNRALGGDRMIYGRAKADYMAYLEELSGERRSVKEQLKDRIAEFSKEWEDNSVSAIFHLVEDTLKTGIESSIGFVASLDNSFMGRQGLWTLMTHPTAWWDGAYNSFADMVKVLGGKEARRELMADMYSRDNFKEYIKAKIITKNEEQYPSHIPSRIPVIGRAFSASEQAFFGSALRMRMDLYDLLTSRAKANGVDFGKKGEIENWGKLINSLTARGAWGKKGDPVTLKLLLWAPKMLKGHLDVLTAHGLGSGLKESKYARQEAFKNIMKITAETALIMAIADALVPGSIEWDSKSSDFGKIKIGNTRFDITGGAAALVVFASRMVKGLTKSTTTGLTTQKARWDIFLDFLRGKANPPIRMLTDWMIGENWRGEKFSWTDSAINAFTPISIQNAIDLKDEQSLASVMGVFLDAVGISSNTYSNDNITNRDIINKLRSRKQLTSKQRRYLNGLNESQKRYIYNQINYTPMESAFRSLSIEDTLIAWNRLEPKYKKPLREIFNQKIQNHANDLDGNELKEFYKKVRKAEMGKGE